MAIEFRWAENTHAKIYKIGTCPDNRNTPDYYDRWQVSSRLHFGDIDGLSLHTDCVKIEIYHSDRLIRIEYDRGGRLHKENGPAEIRYDMKGVIQNESWLINGYYHREGAPAFTMYEKNGPGQQQWRIHGKLHRIDGPADEWWSGNIKGHEHWVLNGIEHRIGGPSHWDKWSENQYLCVRWKQHGEFHREDGPALQAWNEDGTLSCSQWYWRGKKAEEWQVLAQAVLPTIHTLLPQPIAEEIVEQLAF